MTDAATFLKSTREAAGPALKLALGANVGQGLLAVAVAWTLSGIIDAAVFHQADLTALGGRLAVLAALAVVRAALAWIADQAGFRAAADVRRHVFRRLLDHVVALGPVRLAGRRTGDLVTTLTEAVAAIEPYWRHWIAAMARVAVLPLAILLVVLPFDRLSALVFVVTLPLIPWFMILIGQGAERANQRQWRSLARLGGHLLDALQGLTDLKLFGASKREIEVVRQMAERYRRDTMSVLRLAFLSALVLEFFATVSIAVVAVLIGFRLMWGEMDFRAGFFILLLAPEFYAPLRNMGVQRHARMEAVAAAERLVDLLDLPAPPAAGHVRPDFGGAVALRFENVHVTHSDGRRALRGIDLGIAAGEHVALVGASGAGKSTLLALLLGFVAPSDGRILVDGVALADLDLDTWRHQIVHVPQVPHLFAGTIDDNIAMGRDAPDGDLTGTIERALAGAHATAFVARLPRGRATRLGERGLGISGGEAQRLALARAAFAPGPLVLFDEPTAHLDRETEGLVGAALAELSLGRTRITIAHRLATVAAADRIVVMEDGRIVETGAPSALLAAGGRYAEMVAVDRSTTAAATDEDGR